VFPVVRGGRPIERTDVIGGERVTLVNEALVKRYWAKRRPDREAHWLPHRQRR
jgi:hypothetical protein